MVNLPQSPTTNRFKIAIANPQIWLSAVTFLGTETNPFPDSVIFHVVNESIQSLRLETCRLWLPGDNRSWRALLPQPWLTNLAKDLRLDPDARVADRDRLDRCRDRPHAHLLALGINQNSALPSARLP